MSNRLPLDNRVLAYFGFDEANVGDPAVDETVNHADLTVVAAAGVRAARLGNGRQFDGTNTVATPADSAVFRTLGNGSCIIGWFILDSVNSAGDFLRPFLSLDGPGAGPEDSTVYSIGVDNTGALYYRYDRAPGEPVIFKTAASTIHINRYYSVAFNLTYEDAKVRLTVRVNDVATPWASVTENGVPAADPNDLITSTPQAIHPFASQTFTVGGSQKTASRWHGVIDELSVHDTPRAVQPYLHAAYYRITLATAFNRLSDCGTVRTVGTVEMGGGTRWWVYERDQSLYAVRENSLGLFSAEVQITTQGTLAGVPIPGGTSDPALAYDAATDTLLVVFLSAGRVYKVTAKSEDAPTTNNMPDPPDVIRPNDYAWTSAGQTARVLERLTTTQAPPVMPPNISFHDIPSFGVAVEAVAGSTGAILYEVQGGHEIEVGRSTVIETSRKEAGSYYQIPITSRRWGTAYKVALIGQGGAIFPWAPRVMVDYLGQAVALWTTPNTIFWNRDGNATPQDKLVGNAGEAPSRADALRQVTTYPIKVARNDAFTHGAGEAPERYAFAQVTTYPMKRMLEDSASMGGGASTRLDVTRAGERPVYL